MFHRYVYDYKIHVITLMIICIALIFIYNVIVRVTGTDVLSTPICDNAVFQKIDGWSVTHLVFFMVLGILYPDHYASALVAGIAWEGVEVGIGKVEMMMDKKKTHGYGKTFWYGRGSDIIMDMIGYTIGSSFAPCPTCETLPCKR